MLIKFHKETGIVFSLMLLSQDYFQMKWVLVNYDSIVDGLMKHFCLSSGGSVFLPTEMTFLQRSQLAK